MEAALFNFWEYINGNQTFTLDSHRPFSKRAGIGRLPAYTELTELEVESDLGRLLVLAALVGCIGQAKAGLENYWSTRQRAIL